MAIRDSCGGMTAICCDECHETFYADRREDEKWMRRRECVGERGLVAFEQVADYCTKCISRVSKAAETK